jgi:hypothetical protein
MHDDGSFDELQKAKHRQPEGLEATLTPQDLADLITFLRHPAL